MMTDTDGGRMKKMLLLASLTAFALITVNAQATTYDNVAQPTVNAGDHGWVTYYFGESLPDGDAGTASLIIQCTFDRAQLITNFGVYGQQAVSNWFAVTCSQQTVNGVTSYVLNATPLQESLVMTDGNGNKTNLNLTINSANWNVTGYGRYVQVNGRAEIVY